MKLRINRLISDAGLGSRREVEEIIRQGRIFINGRRALLGDMVGLGDTVLLDGVDLPIKDLIREHLSMTKVTSKERAKNKGKRPQGGANNRAESQRLLHASKSASLRKTSKNNPANKYRARLLSEAINSKVIDQGTVVSTTTQRGTRGGSRS